MENGELESKEPEIVEVLAESGEISDELDYFLSKYIMQERGFGLVACQPQLVKLSDGRSAIKMGLDYTFMDSESNQMMGYGIVGYVYIDFEQANQNQADVIFMTDKEDIDLNIEQITSDVDPQPRPRGKY